MGEPVELFTGDGFLYRGRVVELGRGSLAVAAALVKLAATPVGDRPLLEVLTGQPAGQPRPTGIFLGPEGGFAEDELSALLAGGAEPVDLGPTMLRVETAAVVAAGAVVLWASWASSGAGERTEGDPPCQCAWP